MVATTEATTGETTTDETTPEGESTVAPETTEAAPAADPVYGGTLVVSGEAEATTRGSRPRCSATATASSVPVRSTTR